MSLWYLHEPAANRRLGPMETEAARAEVARMPGLLAWREGMADWLPARSPLKRSRRRGRPATMAGFVRARVAARFFRIPHYSRAWPCPSSPTSNWSPATRSWA